MPDDPFRLLAANATDYAMFTMDVDGLVGEWSPGAERIFGFGEAEMRGRSADVLFVVSDREAGVPDLERSLAVRAGRAENERWHLRKDGSQFWGAGMMFPLFGDDHENLGFAKIVRDFTRRRELEAAHIEAQRVERVGLFAGGLAHLFNNLLTVSLGNLDLLLRLPGVRSSPEAQELGAHILRAERRMADLTQQVLAYAGQARTRMQPIDLCDVIQEAVDRLRPRVPEHISLTMTLPERCPSIAGDAALLRQLVVSLIDNALEALSDPAGGRIILAVDSFELTPAASREHYHGFDLVPGRHLRLRVTDTGPGLDQETRAHLFDPFYTTKFQGRGMGLAAALGVARMHGGAITAAGAPDGGTCLEVVLPADGEALRRDRSSRMALVADDEELVRSLTAKILEAEGFTVVQAENGQQAVKIAERLGDRIELVLLDLVMPVQDGAATYPRLRDVLPDAPVILMTGLVLTADAEARLQDLGAVDRLHKPFTYDQLTAAVHAAVGRVEQDDVRADPSLAS